MEGRHGHAPGSAHSTTKIARAPFLLGGAVYCQGCACRACTTALHHMRWIAWCVLLAVQVAMWVAHGITASLRSKLHAASRQGGDGLLRQFSAMDANDDG